MSNDKEITNLLHDDFKLKHMGIITNKAEAALNSIEDEVGQVETYQEEMKEGDDLDETSESLEDNIKALNKQVQDPDVTAKDKVEIKNQINELEKAKEAIKKIKIQEIKKQLEGKEKAENDDDDDDDDDETSSKNAENTINVKETLSIFIYLEKL